MKALVFPGQGAQFVGMGKELYDQSPVARKYFDEANEILGFDIRSLMFEGTEEDLKRTSVTQPAIYIHSVAAAFANELEKVGKMAAGHSLGEFSALTVAGVLDFADGLRLVSIRAGAMQKACDMQKSTMAAILGLSDEDVEDICQQVKDVVVPANYNTTGQLVISGSISGVDEAMDLAKTRGALRVIPLNVNGAFHSPLMEPARIELADGINRASFSDARIPVYQNVHALPQTAKEAIKENLLMQLTSPVRWTQTIRKMIDDGASGFVEAGPGSVLKGLIRKIDRKMEVENVS